MDITFLGHSGFYIRSDQTNICIDPFLTDNPAAVNQLDDLKPQYILVTHGHSDHLGDTEELAKRNNSTVVSVFEIANYLAHYGINVHPMHIGGSHNFGNFIVKLIFAAHGSSIGDFPAYYMGNPCGFIIKINGVTIYHSGDTGLFGDMQLIGSLNQIDLALLPIGDNYTMGPEDALLAAKYLKAKTIIPMHYNTWDLIAQDDLKFKESVEKETFSEVVILKPGEKFSRY